MQKDLLGIQPLSAETIRHLLTSARRHKAKVRDPAQRDDTRKHVALNTLFYENSTRTKMSFLMAGEYLGAKAADLNVATGSVCKGETFLDTGKVLDRMGIDVLVVRHGMAGAPHLLARNVRACVVNGGDGSNEHPTQALLDALTILEHKGSFTGLNVAIVGDIANSRVARSNVFLLKTMGASVTLVGPATMLSAELATLGAAVTTDVRQAVRDADVVMALRIQAEREKGSKFPSLTEYARYFGVNASVLEGARPDALVMHPGPVNRGVELTADVIDGARSVILDQVENGVAVRMAVLEYCLEGLR